VKTVWDRWDSLTTPREPILINFPTPHSPKCPPQNGLNASFIHSNSNFELDILTPLGITHAPLDTLSSVVHKEVPVRMLLSHLSSLYQVTLLELMGPFRLGLFYSLAILYKSDIHLHFRFEGVYRRGSDG